MAEAAFRLSKAHSLLKGKCEALKNIAEAYFGLNDFQKSISCYQQAVKLNRDRNDRTAEAYCLNAIGYTYRHINNYKDALNFHLKSLKIAEEIDDQERISAALHSIGLLYHNLHYYKKALAYYERSLEIDSARGDQLGIAINLNNIGIMYKYIEANYPEKALDCYKKALEIYTNLNDKKGIASMLCNMANIFLERGNISGALKFQMQSLRIEEELKNQEGIAYSYASIADVYRKAGDISQAIQYKEKALEITNDLEFKQSIYDSLRVIYEHQKNFQKALFYTILASSCHDSLHNLESQSQMSDLQLKYETEKKDGKIELLELRSRQQVIMIGASATLAIVLIIVVLLIIKSRRKLRNTYLLVNRQKEELETTLDKLKQTQSQLIQSEKMASLGMLTAGIAHEINNPINFINSGAISLQKDYEDLQRFIESINQISPESQKIADEIGMKELQKSIPQTIEDIKTGVQRTSEIVKGLRNFTRLDISEQKEAQLHEGIDSTLLLLSHKFKDRIRIVKNYDEEIGFIRCYPGPLNQVFMNLLNNAIDAIDQKIKKDQSVGNYLADSYQVAITTKLIDTGEKKQVKIIISDNGVGIPDEIRDKLFIPFFTTKDVGKGTGLGLSICHGIIEKHGGNIFFESKVNEGSIFTITIPIA
ncbi:MAG: tetratricopeptide repeat protein [Bacteroidota bacterium]